LANRFFWTYGARASRMDLGTIHIKSPKWRNRLWLINTFAVVLIAGEALGYDRMLKASTTGRGSEDSRAVAADQTSATASLMATFACSSPISSLRGHGTVTRS
jgi:hypothetical protein